MLKKLGYSGFSVKSIHRGGTEFAEIGKLFIKNSLLCVLRGSTSSPRPEPVEGRASAVQSPTPASQEGLQSRKLEHSALQHLILSLPCILLLITGCQQRNEVIAGVEVPIPAKMTKNPDKVFDPIPEFKDGQVSYQGKVSPKEIFDFYQEVMAAKGWQPTARFAGVHKDSIGYTKGNRLVLVRYNENPDGITVLTVMVGTQDPPK